MLGIGATILDVAADHPTFRVYADPVGAPVLPVRLLILPLSPLSR